MCTDSTNSFIQIVKQTLLPAQSPEEEKAAEAPLNTLLLHLHLISICFAIRLCCITFSFLDKLFNIQ